jgi:xylitol oxidase
METNWAGTHHYAASSLARPRSVEELRGVVASASHVRALGTRHSFTALPDTEGTLVTLSELPLVIDIDSDAREVSVSAGATYGVLAHHLHREGWALPNLASLPHISVAGAVATGTHGSGDALQSLAASVVALELMDADGDVRTVDRTDPDFAGYVVSLGSLGVVIGTRLRIEPTYDVVSTQFTDLGWQDLGRGFESVMGSGDSVSLFTHWTQGIDQVWVKRRGSRPVLELPGAELSSRTLHMLTGGDPDAISVQREARPWHEALPHFRLERTPSRGEEIQSEYFVPRHHAGEAIEGLRTIGPLLADVLQVSEVRTIASDDLWLSGAYGRDTVAFHFTWVRRPEDVSRAVTLVEDVLAPFDARPHWGKCFSVEASVLATVHPRLAAFVDLTTRADPGRKFWNSFLQHRLRPFE